MGSPTVYVYWEADGPLSVLTLATALSDLNETVGAKSTVAEALDGSPYTTYDRPTLRVRIEIERFGSPGANAVERALMALQNHLDRGGLIGFAKDHAKAFCGVIPAGLVGGSTVLRTRGNGFSAWSASGAVAADDEVVIESSTPTWRREISSVASVSGNTVTLSEATRYSHPDTSCIVRHRDFYPVLFRPESERGRPIVTSDRRRNYTLDMELEYAVELAHGLFRDATWTTGYEGSYFQPDTDRILSGALPFSDATAPYGSAIGRTLDVIRRPDLSATVRR